MPRKAQRVAAGSSLFWRFLGLRRVAASASALPDFDAFLGVGDTALEADRVVAGFQDVAGRRYRSSSAVVILASTNTRAYPVKFRLVVNMTLVCSQSRQSK